MRIWYWRGWISPPATWTEANQRGWRGAEAEPQQPGRPGTSAPGDAARAGAAEVGPEGVRHASIRAQVRYPNLRVADCRLGCGVWSFAVIAAVADPCRPRPSRWWKNSSCPTPSSRSREGQLERAIARANTDGAAALLIELNTPGGLVDSMRNMAGAILSSRVPVIVYVAPGRRARRLGRLLSAGGGRHRRHGSRHQCRRGPRGLRVRQARRNHDAEGRERRRGLSALLCDPAQPQRRCRRSRPCSRRTPIPPRRRSTST